jgi:SAM-dependent methyltransferase
MATRSGACKCTVRRGKLDNHVLPETPAEGDSGHCTARLSRYSTEMTSVSDPVSAWDQATLAFYSHEAPAYVAKSKAGASRWLDNFMQALPARARVLDLGCGSGRNAEVLLAHGFEVDQRLGRPVCIMRFDELSAVNAYDGIWANASLLHVPRAALSETMALVLRALKPGGLHFASYKAGDSAGRDILGRYYNYLDRNAVKHFYSLSGRWDVLSVTDYIGSEYEGRPALWIAITARKPPE